MATGGRSPDAAELGRRVWDDLRGRAGERPRQFSPVTRKDVSGWLWDGALASLIRVAVAGIADRDLRRAREYLNASGMITNAGGGQRGGAAVVYPRRLASRTGRPCARGLRPSV